MATETPITTDQVKAMWPHLDDAKAAAAVAIFAAGKPLNDVLREHPNADMREGLLRQMSQVLTSAVATL